MRLSALLALGTITLVDGRGSNTKRDGNCTTNTLGKGPVPSPDTTYDFLSSPELASSANNAPTPSSYIQSFKNQKAATQARSYLGYVALDSYDTNACASHCTAKEGCQGFNIFFERDPTIGPGPGCTDPSSTTVIKCTLWGVAVTAKNAVNFGQKNDEFALVIAGSNGYNNQKVGNGDAQGFAIDTVVPVFPVLLALVFVFMFAMV